MLYRSEKISVSLSNGFSIHAIQTANTIAVELHNANSQIGMAHLLTDLVDVICVTAVQIDEAYAQTRLANGVLLSNAFIEFLIHFPAIVEKSKFTFIFNVPADLVNVVTQHAIQCDQSPSLQNEIMLRRSSVSVTCAQPQNIIFKDAINDAQLADLLVFLRANAYWQSGLTMRDLKLIIANSICFFAYTNAQELVGFARVLTDSSFVASLWDVAVAKNYRGQGIGMAMMNHVFTHPSLQAVDTWILFTDTAKPFYQKFGFVTAGKMPDVCFYVNCLSVLDQPVSSARAQDF